MAADATLATLFFFNCACSSIGMSFKVMLAIDRHHNVTTLVFQWRIFIKPDFPALQKVIQPAGSRHRFTKLCHPC